MYLSVINLPARCKVNLPDAFPRIRLAPVLLLLRCRLCRLLLHVSHTGDDRAALLLPQIAPIALSRARVGFPTRFRQGDPFQTSVCRTSVQTHVRLALQRRCRNPSHHWLCLHGRAWDGDIRPWDGLAIKDRRMLAQKNVAVFYILSV